MTSSRATRGIWCTSCEPCSHSTHRRRPSGGRGWRRTRAISSLSGRRAVAGDPSHSSNPLLQGRPCHASPIRCGRGHTGARHIGDAAAPGAVGRRHDQRQDHLHRGAAQNEADRYGQGAVLRRAAHGGTGHDGERRHRPRQRPAIRGGVRLERRSARPAARRGRAVRPERLPVYPPCRGPGCEPAARHLQRRPDVAQHPSAREAESGVEQVAADRRAADPHEVRETRVHSGQVQRPPVDARLVRGPADHPPCAVGTRRGVQHHGTRARQVHGDGMARAVLVAERGRERQWERDQDGQFHLQGDVVLSRAMGKLFAVVLTIITVVSTAFFAARTWWLPVDISAHGHAIDRQLMETMVSSGALFVLSQLALAVFVWRYGDRDDGRRVRTFPGGVTPMVLFATVLVGAEILALTFVGSKVWAGIYQTPADPGSLQIDVQSEQFAFYFRYAGADGAFGATHPELINEANENYFGLDPAHDVSARDDIVVPTLTVPVNRPVALTLRAKDVSHAFYVPELRIQQDFVPGLAIPLHFTATRTGKYAIVCTQLCGLGHYNMRAFIEVVSPAQFDQWLKDKAAQQ